MKRLIYLIFSIVLAVIPGICFFGCSHNNSLDIKEVFIKVNGNKDFKTEYFYGDTIFTLQDIKVFKVLEDDSVVEIENGVEYLFYVDFDNNKNMANLPDFLTNGTGCSVNTIPNIYWFTINIPNAPEYKFSISILKANLLNTNTIAVQNNVKLTTGFSIEWNSKNEASSIEFKIDKNTNLDFITYYIKESEYNQFLELNPTPSSILKYIENNKINLNLYELQPDNYYAISIVDESDYFNKSVSNPIKFKVVNKDMPDMQTLILNHTITKLNNYTFKDVYNQLDITYIFNDVNSVNHNQYVNFKNYEYNLTTEQWVETDYSTIENNELQVYAIQNNGNFYLLEYKNDKWLEFSSGIEVDESKIVKVSYTNVFEYKDNLSIEIPIYTTFSYIGNKLFYNFSKVYVNYIKINKATIDVKHANSYDTNITYTDSVEDRQNNINFIKESILNCYDEVIKNLIVLPKEFNFNIGEHEFVVGLENNNIAFVKNGEIFISLYKYNITKIKQQLETLKTFKTNFDKNGKINLETINFILDNKTGCHTNCVYELIEDEKTTGNAILSENILIIDLNEQTNPNGNFNLKITKLGNEIFDAYNFYCIIETSTILSNTIKNEFEDFIKLQQNYSDGKVLFTKEDIFKNIVETPNLYSDYGVWKWCKKDQSEIQDNEKFSKDFVAYCKFVPYSKWLIEGCEILINFSLKPCDHFIDELCGICTHCYYFVGKEIIFEVGETMLNVTPGYNYFKITNIDLSSFRISIDLNYYVFSESGLELEKDSILENVNGTIYITILAEHEDYCYLIIE